VSKRSFGCYCDGSSCTIARYVFPVSQRLLHSCIHRLFLSSFLVHVQVPDQFVALGCDECVFLALLRFSSSGPHTSWVVDRLVLSHQGLCNADRHASEDSLLGINQVPHSGVGQCSL